MLTAVITAEEKRQQCLFLSTLHAFPCCLVRVAFSCSAVSFLTSQPPFEDESPLVSPRPLLIPFDQGIISSQANINKIGYCSLCNLMTALGKSYLYSILTFNGFISGFISHEVKCCPFGVTVQLCSVLCHCQPVKHYWLWWVKMRANTLESWIDQTDAFCQSLTPIYYITSTLRMEQKSVSYIYICISCEATDRRNQWMINQLNWFWPYDRWDWDEFVCEWWSCLRQFVLCLIILSVALFIDSSDFMPFSLILRSFDIPH